MEWSSHLKNVGNTIRHEYIFTSCFTSQNKYSPFEIDDLISTLTLDLSLTERIRQVYFIYIDFPHFRNLTNYVGQWDTSILKSILSQRMVKLYTDSGDSLVSATYRANKFSGILCTNTRTNDSNSFKQIGNINEI